MGKLFDKFFTGGENAMFQKVMPRIMGTLFCLAGLSVATIPLYSDPSKGIWVYSNNPLLFTWLSCTIVGVMVCFAGVYTIYLSFKHRL